MSTRAAPKVDLPPGKRGSSLSPPRLDVALVSPSTVAAQRRLLRRRAFSTVLLVEPHRPRGSAACARSGTAPTPARAATYPRRFLILEWGRLSGRSRLTQVIVLATSWGYLSLAVLRTATVE